MAEAFVTFLEKGYVQKGLRALEIPGHADALLGSSAWGEPIIEAIGALSDLKELKLQGECHTPAYLELLERIPHAVSLHSLHVSSIHWKDSDDLIDITQVWNGGYSSISSLQRLEGTFTIPSSEKLLNLAQFPFSELEVLELHHNTVCNIEDYFCPFPSLHTLSFVSSPELDPQGPTEIDTMHARAPTGRHADSLGPELATLRDLARWRVLKTLKGSIRQLHLLKDSLLQNVAVDTLELTIEPNGVDEQADMLGVILQNVPLSRLAPRTVRLRLLMAPKEEVPDPLAVCLGPVSDIVDSHSRAQPLDAHRQPWDALEVEVVSTGAQPTMLSVTALLVSPMYSAGSF